MTAADLPVLSVIGATATGKSDLAVALAQTLGGEIINSDSMQFYRGMDIGTAKLPASERGGIPHHLLDVLDVREEASVAAYQADARRLIGEIRGRGRVPIFVGGSGLYARAAVDVMSFPGTDPDVRARLEAEVAETGPNEAHLRLREVDPAAAEKIAPGDARRIVRALEVLEITGEPFSAHLPRYEYAIEAVQIGLAIDRGVLHERIRTRIDRMFDAGWVAEVEALLERGLAEGRTASQAIGYAQIAAMLSGTLSEDEARESTVVRTRQFARRQETWFRRDERIRWIEALGDSPLDAALAQIPGA